MAIKRKVVTTFEVVNRGNPNTLDGWTSGRGMIYVHIEDGDGKDNENNDDTHDDKNYSKVKHNDNQTHMRIIDEDLEMSVAELFPDENCPRPGTNPSECSSDNLFSWSGTSGG